MTIQLIKKQTLALVAGTVLMLGSSVAISNEAAAGSTFGAVYTNNEVSAGIMNAGGNFHFGIGINPWGHYGNHGYGWGGPIWNDHSWKPKRKRYVVTGGFRRGFVPLRAHPGRGAPKLAFIPHRSKRVFGRGKTVRRHGVSWTKVRFHGQVGWVKSRQLRRIR